MLFSKSVHLYEEEKEMLNMKASKVMKTLQISCSTSYHSIIARKIRSTKLERGRDT